LYYYYTFGELEEDVFRLFIFFYDEKGVTQKQTNNQSERVPALLASNTVVQKLGTKHMHN